MNDMAKIFLSIIALLVFLMVAIVKLDSIACASRWEDSGRKHDWSFNAGCRVSDKDGNLVPEKVVRDIQ